MKSTTLHPMKSCQILLVADMKSEQREAIQEERQEGPGSMLSIIEICFLWSVLG